MMRFGFGVREDLGLRGGRIFIFVCNCLDKVCSKLQTQSNSTEKTKPTPHALNPYL